MNLFEPQLTITDDKQQGSAIAKDGRELSIDAATIGDSPRTLHPQPLSILWSCRYLLSNVRTALPLAIVDQLVLISAVWMATWSVRTLGASDTVFISAIGLSLSGGLLIAFAMGQLYPGAGLSTGAEVRQCSFLLSLLFVLFLLASLAYSAPIESMIVVVATGVLCLIFIPLCRNVTRKAFGQFRWWTQPVLVFGDGSASRSLVQKLGSNPNLGLLPVGILDDFRVHWSGDGNGQGQDLYFGPHEAAAEISRTHSVFRAIVAMPDRPTLEFHKTIALCADLFPHVIIVPESNICGPSLVGKRDWSFHRYSGFESRSRLLSPIPNLLKRAMDLMLVSALGLLAIPFMFAIAAAIRFSSAGPVFFAQERIGRGGKRFRMWKFRTMLADAERILEDYLEGHPELRAEWEAEHKLEDDPRVIPSIGRLLRKSSLDELPQLWNVLKGDMSLVGPRPLPQYHLDTFDPQFCRYRERITPGVTGLWQVSSRSDGRPEMFAKCDTAYIQNWSLLLDLQILWRTLKVVIYGTGAC